MPTDAEPILVSSADRADPGDETFRRFRYQATYAATLTVQLLDSGGDGLELYCEQYEDILVRLASGRFRGIQVKTKADDGGPLRATDDRILDALGRFIELDLSFPGHFEGFTLASNASFDGAGRGHGNLRAVMAEATAYAATPTTVCAKARRLAKTLLKRFKTHASAAKKALWKKGTPRSNKATKATTSPPGAASVPNPTEVDVLRMLAKLDVQDDLPKLPDIRGRMRDRLIQLSPKVAGSTLPAVERLLDALEYAAYLAASRGDEDKNGRCWFIADPQQRLAMTLADELRGKCLSRGLVDEAIGRHCAGGLLVSAEPVPPAPISADLTLLERKLVAGGLSVGTLNFARDAVASVEEFGVRLLYVHDEVDGYRRYNHARTVVKRECVLAYESQAASGHVNGPKMLADVETRLKQRRAEDPSGVLKEAQEEHLLGHVFALTKECVVWWSTSRDLGSTSKVTTLGEAIEKDGTGAKNG